MKSGISLCKRPQKKKRKAVLNYEDEIDITKTQVDESMDEEDKGKNEQNIVQCSEESLNDDRIKPCSKTEITQIGWTVLRDPKELLEAGHPFKKEETSYRSHKIVGEEKEIKINHELELVEHFKTENLFSVNINQVINQGTPTRYTDNIRNCNNLSPQDSGFESSCIHFSNSSNCSELNEIVCSL
ncbi:uncharacterized protein LOC111704558 [Eurytemora carolleeae]|uniref:uncharacterized protein LOC111704558 n=1 Tax=Eurytemora carolleeae TaxID=1294199 RepID=UPI000C7661E6|nr:uncharacterized protein LOC111704558 [Eurytemora carolleeae]|eukprot:XP_023332601.1 uncharacterized protein LOC111704558 [Eurytemora affinis]